MLLLLLIIVIPQQAGGGIVAFWPVPLESLPPSSPSAAGKELSAAGLTGLTLAPLPAAPAAECSIHLLAESMAAQTPAADAWEPKET